MWSIISHSEVMRGKKLNLPICLTRAALIVLFRISACFSTVSFIGWLLMLSMVWLWKFEDVVVFRIKSYMVLMEQ